MKKEIKFTIITVCKNVEKIIEKTILSIVRQTYINIEYIIIDGGSTDGTLDIIKMYANKYPLYYISEQDKGIYDAMNKGIKRCTGDYILFINAGDYLMNRNVISNVALRMEQKKSDIYYGYIGLRFHNRIEIVKEDRGKKYMMLAGYMPGHPGVFANSEKMKRRPFDLSYKICADFDWLIWAKKNHCKFYNLKIPVSVFTMDGVSSKGRYQTLLQNETRKSVIKNYHYMRFFYDIYKGLIDAKRMYEK